MAEETKFLEHLFTDAYSLMITYLMDPHRHIQEVLPQKKRLLTLSFAWFLFWRTLECSRMYSKLDKIWYMSGCDKNGHHGLNMFMSID